MSGSIFKVFELFVRPSVIGYCVLKTKLEMGTVYFLQTSSYLSVSCIAIQNVD